MEKCVCQSLELGRDLVGLQVALYKCPLSIQSLLNENPIHNEPGWETVPTILGARYNDLQCVPI